MTVRAPQAGAMTFTSAASASDLSESLPENDIATLTVPVSLGAKLGKPPPQGSPRSAARSRAAAASGPTA